jgi:hypothetical protein
LVVRASDGAAALIHQRRYQRQHLLCSTIIEGNDFENRVVGQRASDKRRARGNL